VSTAMNINENVLILGSASPRRAKLLAELGVRFEQAIPDVNELFYADMPERTVVANALAKYEWCRQRFPTRWVITADTVLSLRGATLGKPIARGAAWELFRTLSGKTHSVVTAVAMGCGDGRAPELDVVESRVTFKTLGETEIAEYFRKVNPLDKAGGYDIDEHADLIIASYSGSRSNIMGLPLEAVEAWLERVRLRNARGWRSDGGELGLREQN